MAYAGDLGAALLILRVARGLTQRELVRKARTMTPSMLSAYETGRRTPKVHTLRALLKATEFTLADLDMVMAFLRALRGEPVGPAEDRDRLRAEVVGAALRLASGLLALAGPPGGGKPTTG